MYYSQEMLLQKNVTTYSLFSILFSCFSAYHVLHFYGEMKVTAAIYFHDTDIENWNGIISIV